MTLEEIAKKELEEERNREQIEKIKERMRKEKGWAKLFPFKIVIVRRNK